MSEFWVAFWIGVLFSVGRRVMQRLAPIPEGLSWLIMIVTMLAVLEVMAAVSHRDARTGQEARQDSHHTTAPGPQSAGATDHADQERK